MKVAFIDPQSYSNLEKYDHGVLSSLSKYSDIKIDFFGNKKMTLVDEYIKYYLLFNYSGTSVFLPFLYIKSFLIMVLICCYRKYDVIHVQWIKAPVFEIPMYLIIRVFNPRIVLLLTAHNIYPHNSSSFYRYCYKFLYRVFDHVITHDKQALAELKALVRNVSNVHHMHHGPIPFQLVGDVSDEVVSVIQDQEVPYALAFGGASQYKGSDIIAGSWAEIGSRVPMRLIVAGNGWNKYFASFNSETVDVISRRLSEKELHFLVSNAAVILMPYREISQSGVLMSVMPYEKDVLITKVGGLADFMEIYRPQVYIENASICGLSHAIHKYVVAKQENPQFGNWEAATKEYSWEFISDSLFELYLTLNTKRYGVAR